MDLEYRRRIFYDISKPTKMINDELMFDDLEDEDGEIDDLSIDDDEDEGFGDEEEE